MRHRKQRRGLSSSGFTLVELMVVIVILGIIGTIAFVFVLDNPDKAKWEKARTEMGEIHKALGVYAVENDNTYPDSLEAISKSFPGGKVPSDPFTKSPYQYEPQGDTFRLICLGKDQAEGGAEIPNRDIVFDERGLLEEGGN